MEYETVIGLEVHAQLLTRSKMFCACSADYQNAPPNTHVCPVCLGMPGVLPVINQLAVEYTVMTGLALHSEINLHSKFDRKNYPYPDLVKGYQISQFDLPLCKGGWLAIEVDGGIKRAQLNRIHLEEDTAKLTHKSNGFEPYSLIDINRSSVPLMEIVGEPDLRSAEEARQYLIALRRIVRYLGVSTGNMEEGSFRCDANVSLRPKGDTEYGNKVEVKNMNSFRSVFRALEFEVERQTKLLDQGVRIVQETRGWVDDQGITVAQRSKEQAHDYRYFPEPDLPPLELSPEWVEAIRARLPELPEAKRDRFIQEYDLSKYDAEVLTASRAMSEFFETAVKQPVAAGSPGGAEATSQRAKTVGNWCIGELPRLLNASNLEIEEAKITPQGLSELIDLLETGNISQTTAKRVFEEMFTTGQSAKSIVEVKGLVQISGADELTRIVEKVIAANPQAIQDFRAGKQQAVGFLVGQVMRETKGRANPEMATALLREKLAS